VVMTGPLMMDLEGCTLTLEEQCLLQNPLIGGVILFSRNYLDPEQCRVLTDTIKVINPEIVIAVDQEGGRVQRFKNGVTRLPAMGELKHLAQKNNLSAQHLAQELGWLMALEMKWCGVDISFAPVLDIDRNNSKIIGDRAFAHTAAEVMDLAAYFMEGMAELQMPAIGKHFPGHGGVCQDSHLELPLDSRKESVILEDLQVFKALMPKLQGIMPAHVLYTEFDQEKPAGFSPFWIQHQLRDKLNFDGVVFSDDLSMEGAAAFGDFPNRALLAQEAGCDMILVCNNRQGLLEILNSNILKRASTSESRLKTLFHRESFEFYHQAMLSSRRTKLLHLEL